MTQVTEILSGSVVRIGEERFVVGATEQWRSQLTDQCKLDDETLPDDLPGVPLVSLTNGELYLFPFEYGLSVCVQGQGTTFGE